MNINWKEPPPSATGRSGAALDYDAILSALKEHPGRWALIAEEVTPGRGAPLRRRGLDVRLVSAGLGYEKNYMDIYARWPEGKETP